MVTSQPLMPRRRSLPVGLYGSLLPPLLWRTLLYFVPIVLLISYSVWRLESFDIVKEFSFVNFKIILTNVAYRTVIVRTLATALGVTLIDIVIALPLGYWIGRYGERYRSLLTLLVILPL